VNHSTPRPITATLFCALFWGAIGVFTWGPLPEAHGQLFGERNLGAGLNRNPGPSPAGVGAAGAGAAGGMEFRSVSPERFMRGQRRADSFVGGAQLEPGSEFVGRELPTTPGAIRSAIDGSLPGQGVRRSARVNRPLTPTPRNMVRPPRFSFIPDSPTPPEPVMPEGEEFVTRDERLTDLLVRRVSPTASVRIENRRAILQGTVDTPENRRLAEIMLRFEPGVDEVENQLEIAGP
jgi:hypothetical protein